MQQLFKPQVDMVNGRFVVPKTKSGEYLDDVQEIARLEQDGEVVRETIATTDTKEFFTTTINQFFMAQPEDVDRQWEQLFTVQQSRNTSGELLPFWGAPNKASEGVNGIVFKRVGELGEIEFSTIRSSEIFVPHVKYGTALGYSREWFEDGNLPLIAMVTDNFRRSSFDKLAQIHYDLIFDAISGGASGSSPVGGTTLDDFISAINDSVAIMKRNKWEPTHIVVGPEHEDLVLQAQRDVYRDRTLTVSARRLTPIITDYAPAGTAALVRSRDRLISFERQALRLDSFNDLLHDAEVLVGTWRRGIGLGDPLVIRGITGL